MTLSATNQIERRKSNEVTENSQTAEEMPANDPAVTLETRMTEERDVKRAGNQPSDTDNKMTTDIAGGNDETHVNENIENSVQSDDEIITIDEFETDKDTFIDGSTKEIISEGVKKKDINLKSKIDETELKERNTEVTHDRDLCGDWSCENVATKETDDTVKDVMEIFVVCEDRGSNYGTLNEITEGETKQPHSKNVESDKKKTAKMSTSEIFDLEIYSNSDLKQNIIVCETGERDTTLSCDETEVSKDIMNLNVSVGLADRNASDKTTASLSTRNVEMADKIDTCQNEDSKCDETGISKNVMSVDVNGQEKKLITTRNYPETKRTIGEIKESHDSDRTSDPCANNLKPIPAQVAMETEPVKELEEGEIEDPIEEMGQNDQNTEVANTKEDDKACMLESQSGSNSLKLVGEAKQKSNFVRMELNRSQTNKWRSKRDTDSSDFKTKEYYDRDARLGRADNSKHPYRSPREIVDYGDTCYIVVDFAGEELDGVKEDINTSNEELKKSRTTEPLSEDTRICKIKDGRSVDELMGKGKLTEQKDKRYRDSRRHKGHRERRHKSSERSTDRHKRKRHHNTEPLNKHGGKDFQKRKRRHSKSRSRSPRSKRTRYLNSDFKDGSPHSSLRSKDRISVENRERREYSPKDRALADRGIKVFHRPSSSTSAEHNENLSPKRNASISTDSQRNRVLYQTTDNSIRSPNGLVSEARKYYDDNDRIHQNHNSHLSHQNTQRETHYDQHNFEFDQSRKSFEDSNIDRTHSYRNNKRADDGLLSYRKLTPGNDDNCRLFSKQKRSFGNDRVDIPHQSNTLYTKERSYPTRDSCELTSTRKQPRLNMSNTKGYSKELSSSYANRASETTIKESRAGAVLYENDKPVERRQDDYGIKHSQERRSPEHYYNRKNISVTSPVSTDQNGKDKEYVNTFNLGRDFENDTSKFSTDEDEEIGKYSHVSDDESDEKMEEQNLTVTKDDLDSFSDEFRNEIAKEIHRALLKRNVTNLSLDAVNNIIKNETSCSISFESLDDLKQFIQQYPEKFVVMFVVGQDMISAKTDVGICFIYTNDQRKEHQCRDLHICKYYMLNHCPNRNCKFSHDLNAPHNINVLCARGLGDLEEASVKSVMQNLDSRNISTSPFICKFYNNPGGCRTNENCTFLHICLHYINGDCKYATCKRSHDFRDAQPRTILARHGIEPDYDDDAKIIGLIKETLHGDKIKLKRDLSNTRMSSSNNIFNSVINTNKSTLRIRQFGETNRKTQHFSNSITTSNVSMVNINELGSNKIQNITDERGDESDISVEEEFAKQPDYIPFDSDSEKQKSRINKNDSKSRANQSPYR